MKRKFIKIITITIILSMFSIPSFAQDCQSINTLDDLKSKLGSNLSKKDIQIISDCTSEDTMNEFIFEKIDAAASMINTVSKDHILHENPYDSSYSLQEYDLYDNCKLVIELSDTACDLNNQSSAISLHSTSGHEDIWKNYGTRSFTAKATIQFPFGNASMSLINKYHLSQNGIDEISGASNCSLSNLAGTISRGEPVISDTIARTPGASDVNMYCNFTVRFRNSKGIETSQKYKLTSTIGFVSIDKAKEQIKVRQSWNLNKDLD